MGKLTTKKEGFEAIASNKSSQMDMKLLATGSGNQRRNCKKVIRKIQESTRLRRQLECLAGLLRPSARYTKNPSQTPPAPYQRVISVAET